MIRIVVCQGRYMPQAVHQQGESFPQGFGGVHLRLVNGGKDPAPGHFVKIHRAGPRQFPGSLGDKPPQPVLVSRLTFSQRSRDQVVVFVQANEVQHHDKLLAG